MHRTVFELWTFAADGTAEAKTLRADLTRPQFARNVRTREDSGENVDFAIKLPGHENGAPVWLPIDAKFPTKRHPSIYRKPLTMYLTAFEL